MMFIEYKNRKVICSHVTLPLYVRAKKLIKVVDDLKYLKTGKIRIR
jgi:hypothetical protein